MKNSVINTREVEIQNVTLTKSGNKVTFEFDLSKNQGLSSSGKSTLISSSHGEIELSENTFITYNVYRKLPKEERQKAKKVTAAGKKAKPEITPEMLEALKALLSK